MPLRWPPEELDLRPLGNDPHVRGGRERDRPEGLLRILGADQRRVLKQRHGVQLIRSPQRLGGLREQRVELRPRLFHQPDRLRPAAVLGGQTLGGRPGLAQPARGEQVLHLPEPDRARGRVPLGEHHRDDRGVVCLKAGLLQLGHRHAGREQDRFPGDRDQVVERDLAQVHAVLQRLAQDLQRAPARVVGRRHAALVQLCTLRLHRHGIQPLGRIGLACVPLHQAERPGARMDQLGHRGGPALRHVLQQGGERGHGLGVRQRDTRHRPQPGPPGGLGGLRLGQPEAGGELAEDAGRHDAELSVGLPELLGQGRHRRLRRRLPLGLTLLPPRAHQHRLAVLGAQPLVLSPAHPGHLGGGGLARVRLVPVLPHRVDLSGDLGVAGGQRDGVPREQVIRQRSGAAQALNEIPDVPGLVERHGVRYSRSGPRRRPSPRPPAPRTGC